jgi:predicted membrane protein
MARRNDDTGRRGSTEPPQERESCCPNCGSWRHANCDSRSRRHGFGTAIIGIGMLAFGAILLLENFGFEQVEQVFDYWPVLLILVGVSHFVRPQGSRRYLAGVIFIGAGTLILLSNLGYLSFDPWNLWPVVLVLVGLNMILKPFRRRGQPSGVDAAVFEATAILGGARRRLAVADFQGGDAVAILGGCGIDLRDCGSEGGPAEIDTFAFWGGVDIRVPEDWEVQVKGLAILGGYGDKTRGVVGGGGKVLIVRGTAIMGGVEIKN